MKNRIILLILFVLIIISYAIVPNNKYEFGDQATENIFFQETLINFKAQDIIKKYSDFVRLSNSNLYLNNGVEKYGNVGIEKKGPTSLLWEPETVKALSRMLIHYPSVYLFSGFEIFEVVYLMGIFISLLTFITYYYLGKFLINDIFGTFLAVITLSNLYFLQLTWSALEPQLTIYPLLFGVGILSLIILIKYDRNKYAIVIISVVTALSILNGYPNTQLSLPFFFSILIIFFYKELKNKFLFIFIGIILGILLYACLGVIYSNLLGESYFLHFNILFSRFGAIFSGDASNTSGNFIEIIFRSFKLIFIGTDYMHAPHGSGMLLHTPFLNKIESIGFIYGLFILIKEKNNLLIKKIAYVTILFFIIRMFTNDNKILDKDSYDFYFPILLIVTYGVYKFSIKNIYDFTLIKEYRDFCINLFSKKNNNYKIIKYKLLNNYNFSFGYTLLIISVFINCVYFNRIFLLKFDASSWELSGVRQIRSYIKENATNKTRIFVNYSHGLENTIYRLNFFNSNASFYPLTDLVKYYPSMISMDKDINEGVIDKILIIDRGDAYSIGKFRNDLGYSYKFPVLNQYIDFMDPIFIANNLNERSAYNIYQIDKNNIYSKLETGGIDKVDIKKSIFLDGKLESIFLPGIIQKFTLSCNGKNLIKIDNIDNKFDSIHINEDGSFTSVSYINLDSKPLWNLKSEKNNISISKLDDSTVSTLNLAHIYALKVNTKRIPGTFKITNNFGYSISNILVNAPYRLHNDFFYLNSLSIKLYNSINGYQSKFPLDSSEIFSDGTLRYGEHTFFDGRVNEKTSMSLSTNLPLYSDGYVVEYDLFNYGSGMTSFYSNFNGYSESRNYIKINGSDPRLSFINCTNNIDILYSTKSFTKTSDLDANILLKISKR